MNKKFETQAGLVLLILVIIWILLAWLISNSIDINGKSGLVAILGFVIYIIFFIVISAISKKHPTKIFIVIQMVLFVPLIILKFMRPYMAILLHSILYVFFSTILPCFFIILTDYFKVIDVSYENKIFLIFAFGSIISVQFNKFLIKLIFNISLAIKKNSKNIDNLEIIRLTNYLFKPNNIRFFIYLMYLVFMLIYSIKYLDNKSLFDLKSVDTAIMQAFLVFLAFDSLRINSKDISILPSVILRKVISILTFNDDSKKEISKNE